ncbi:hypothetical protein AB0H82_31570 [Streptomyces sp. NPDC050732]|uniref:hypothetical protein n=1 Tax=Streptomyces sp. NPDC050732 TaxID=3154632 RepID=UPI0034477E68
MRRFRTAALATAASLSIITLATGTTPATAQTAAATCGPVMSNAKVSGSLKQCTWDDGRIRIAGTLRDKTLSDGATLLNIRIGTYSRDWVICGGDTPVDTDYQPSGIVSVRWQTSSASNC